MDEEIRFDSLNLSTRISNSLLDMGFEVLTPVQAQVIPPALEGHDILATAQTGTGKTAAYGIPILQLRRRALVLVPTRELALQVQRDLDDMCGRTVPSVCLIGGAPFRDQKRVLKKRPDSNVVATPGRLCDHIDRGTVNLDDIEIFVLDEADEMLSMGFSDDLNRITRAMPRDRQTMLLAATMRRSTALPPLPPRRSTVSLSRTLRIFAWTSMLMPSTSSRKSVPPSASSILPASIFDRSSTSLIRDRRWRPEDRILPRSAMALSKPRSSASSVSISE